MSSSGVRRNQIIQSVPAKTSIFNSYCGEQGERGKNTFFQSLLVFLPVPDREDGSAPHGKPKEDRCQECHKGKGRTHGCQGVCTQKAAYDQCVRNIITLL